MLDKPVGWTSFQCVALVRRLLRQRRVGHAGTLDPLASGILPVCVGQATRVVEYLHDAPKSYLARVRLGVETSTDDGEGAVVATAPVGRLDVERLAPVLPEFQGVIQQVPPAFSAIKVQGRPAYASARRGNEVALRARPVRVDRIEVAGIAGDEFEMRVDCGRGTYIRSLARDIGRRLGCGGHLAALRRTRVGPFRAGLTAAELEEAVDDGSWPLLLRPLDTALAGQPAMVLAADTVRLVAQGRSLALGVVAPGPIAVAYAEHGYATAVMKQEPGGRWRPDVVFSAPA